MFVNVLVVVWTQPMKIFHYCNTLLNLTWKNNNIKGNECQSCVYCLFLTEAIPTGWALHQCQLVPLELNTVSMIYSPY